MAKVVEETPNGSSISPRRMNLDRFCESAPSTPDGKSRCGGPFYQGLVSQFAFWRRPGTAIGPNRCRRGKRPRHHLIRDSTPREKKIRGDASACGRAIVRAPCTASVPSCQCVPADSIRLRPTRPHEVDAEIDDGRGIAWADHHIGGP